MTTLDETMGSPAPAPAIRLQGVAARLAFSFFEAFPVDLASVYGGALGRLVGPCLPASAAARRNLARTLPALTAKERRAALRGMWDNLGRVAAELPHLRRIASDARRIEIVGARHLDALRDSGGAGLFFSAHFGNWEIIPPVIAARGLPVRVVYRAINNQIVDAAVTRYRELGLVPFPAARPPIAKGRRGAREMLSALAKGEYPALLIDQKMNDGIAADFFGRPAMTAPAIAELARRYDCPIVGVRADRLRGARFRVTFLAPIRALRSSDKAADIRATMTRINRVIEGWVRERPDHWLWAHRRWAED